MKGAWLLLMAFQSPAPPAVQPPVLVSFTLNDSASVVRSTEPLTLSHRVVGARPTHYRVSTRADFADARWNEYSPRVVWAGPRAGGAPCLHAPGLSMLRLFLQVRTTTGQELRVVDGHRRLVDQAVESNVLGDTICVER